jgi:hypothetical protein
MRLLRLALISFILLFLLVMGISLFIPSHIRISKAINLKSDNNKVMNFVADPAQWKSWYPGLDSSRLLTEQGVIKGVFLTRQPKPYLRLVKKEGDEITAEFAGHKMNPVINVWQVIGDARGDSVVFQWYMDFDLRWYPWEKFASLLLEKSYGPKMEQGLNSLKKLVEN